MLIYLQPIGISSRHKQFELVEQIFRCQSNALAILESLRVELRKFKKHISKHPTIQAIPVVRREITEERALRKILKDLKSEIEIDSLSMYKKEVDEVITSRRKFEIFVNKESTFVRAENLIFSYLTKQKRIVGNYFSNVSQKRMISFSTSYRSAVVDRIFRFIARIKLA